MNVNIAIESSVAWRKGTADIIMNVLKTASSAMARVLFGADNAQGISKSTPLTACWCKGPPDWGRW